MKKQYDIKRLTDDLSRSVFFQEPKQTDTPTYQHQSSAEKQHTIVPTQHQSMLADKSARLQVRKQASPQAGKSARPQADMSAKPQDRKTAFEKAERYTVRLFPSLVKRMKDYAYFHDMNDKDVVHLALIEFLDKREKDR